MKEYVMRMLVSTPHSNYLPQPKKVIVATDNMKTDTMTIPLFGHGLEVQGNLAHDPIVTGSFASYVVTGSDGEKYGVFTVTDNHPATPSEWAGSYRINVSRLVAAELDVFA